MKPRLRARLFAYLVLALGAVEGRTCTIFVLTDRENTLFFNNEDFSNPASRLWFVPAGKDYLGCAYVGFDDGWAQGGVNTAGVAFDWVAGGVRAYEPAAELRRVRGNSSQRMLETCTTVDEAIAFYRTHRETEFKRATILIADRSGASVVISAENGTLKFDRAAQCRGFGYGEKVLRGRLASPPAATFEAGADILRACRQGGATPTQYANSFDLRTGELLVYADLRRESVRLNLAAELAKGGHSYDIPRLSYQLATGGRELAREQQRFYLDTWRPRAQPEAALVSKISQILRDAAQGRMQEPDYGPDMWAHLAPRRVDFRGELGRLGELRRIVLVDSPDSLASEEDERCIAEFTGARVLQRWQFDAGGRVTGLASEFVELERP